MDIDTNSQAMEIAHIFQPVRPKPELIILEQPKDVRFRYICEGKSADPILGQSSTKDFKTYPRIRIDGYVGKAHVVVSCVTADEPYYPHPHNLVGKDGCSNGVCKRRVPSETMTLTFNNMGIQCVKRCAIQESLDSKEAHKIDPFKTGFRHKLSPNKIDLNSVRLCFQAFIEDKKKNKWIALDPVVSELIHHIRTVSDLNIVKLSECVCPADGGQKDIIMLCDRVVKGNIEIRFFEEKNGEVVWEAFGEFQPHGNMAMSFRPPPYRDLNIIEPVTVFIQLRRPSDRRVGEALPFQYISMEYNHLGNAPMTRRNVTDYQLSEELTNVFSNLIQNPNNYVGTLHEFDPFWALSQPSTSGNGANISLNTITVEDIASILPPPEYGVSSAAQLSSSDLTIFTNIENNIDMLSL